jgi:anthranilate phosphoribosyltransferase
VIATGRALLERLLAREDLGEDDGARLLGVLTDADVPDALKAGLLVALRAKGETGTELRGMALAMRRAAVPVPLPAGLHAVDTCGTGGDGRGSFNVSTAAALVVAAAGVPVVKHGNRSVSSRSGSADLLDALGVRLAATPHDALRQLAALGFTFLFAPAFHPATAAVMPARRALGVRTAFNLLGPLTNPAAPAVQLVGAFSATAARCLADALSGMPIARAVVVHGDGGWDEATPCGRFLRLDVTPGRVDEAEVDPHDAYGVPRATEAELAGGDAADNAARLRSIVGGERSAVRDAVLINAALALEVAGAAPDPASAFALAAAALDDGRAAALLDGLVERS